MASIFEIERDISLCNFRHLNGNPKKRAHYLKNKNKLNILGKQFVIFVKLNDVIQGKILSFVPLIN